MRREPVELAGHRDDMDVLERLFGDGEVIAHASGNIPLTMTIAISATF